MTTRSVLFCGKLISHEHRFILFLTPKVATTSLRRALTRSHKDLFQAEPLDASTPEVLESTAYDSYFKFAFVRSPWTRVVSCWASKVADPYAKPNSEGVLAILERYQGLRPGMPFAEFVLWLNGAEGRDELADRHWASQHLILGNRPLEDLDFIGRYEDLQSDFQTVCARMGLEEIELPKTNISGRSPSGKLKKHMGRYTQDLLELVETRYKNDVVTFGYERPRL